MNAVVQETGEAAAPAPAPKAPAEVVKMTDGRNVEFAGKKKLLKEGTVNPDGTLTVRLDFKNGETRSVVLPAGLIPQFALHGALQKYGDEVAGETDVDDMVLAIDELDKRIQAGEWTVKREGGMSGTSVLIKALMEYGNRTVEQVKAFLEGKSAADKAALRNNDKKANKSGLTVAAIVKRLEAEKAAKASKVDTDSMLEGFDAA